MLIPDPRPSKAHPEARAARKEFEKKNPHFNMQEFGMKAGALALFAAVTLFPWQKEHEKHERAHHPERFADKGEKGNGDQRGSSSEERRGGERDDRDSRRSRRRGGDSDRRRRQSEGGDRQREYRMFMDRDREYRSFPGSDAAPSSVGRGYVGDSEEEERYTGRDDGDYGRQYMEAARRERGSAASEYGRRTRRSVDYDRRRSRRDER